MSRFVRQAVIVPAVFLAVTMSLRVYGDTPWAFTKPVRPRVPTAKALKGGNPVNPIDAFILRMLERHDLDPAPAADRNTLVRRAYVDLLGLPPAPEQVEEFVNDLSDDAWPNLINRLLESKQYGERWGRHWLDVARYADSGGYETDIYRRNAWRYRDYVVKSFNDDKPYDRFVQEQIAGDELWPDNLDLDPKRVYKITEAQQQHLEALTGTGLYTLGPLIHESRLDARRLHYETLTDWADTTGSVFLGLTFGCARCHEHKFDPITQTDYFAMQAVFASSREVEVSLMTAMETGDTRQAYPRLLAIDEARKRFRLYDQKVAGRKLTAEEAAHRQKLLEDIAHKVLALPAGAASVPGTKYDGLMEIPKVTVLGHESEALLKPVHRLGRGELYNIQEKVEPALPASLAKATRTKKELPGPFGSRKALAQWLTRPDHPLTARVMVNRMWYWHFGRGLVATPNDFGAMGQPPTHPQLLDWLATEFVARGWSVKEMHRLMMTSATYQMSSQHTPEKSLTVDPENNYLWRMNRRRLEAEALWDAVHATAGTINLKMGGRPVVPPLAEDEIASLRDSFRWPVSADPAEHTRRGMYILVLRNFRFPMFSVYDAPVSSVSCPTRDVTTVAPQALWSLNNRSVYTQAKAFADRVRKEAGKKPGDWVDRVWMIAVARHPSETETREAVALMERLSRPESDTPVDALAQLCLGVYNLNEFAFVD